MSTLIERALSDLVQRQLLRAERRQGDRVVHGMVFPHHLRVLQGLAEPSFLGALVREVGHGASGATFNETSWLSAVEVEKVRTLCSSVQHEPLIVPALFALGGRDVLSRPRFVRGVLDAVGFERGRVLNSPSSLRPDDYPRECSVLGVAANDVGGVVESISRDGRVPLIVGGADLWHFNAADPIATSGGLAAIDLIPLRRLPKSRVRWWLEIARGLTFARTEDLTRIVAACAGIPFMVARADDALAGADGSAAGRQVSGSEVDALLDVLSREPGIVAKRFEQDDADWQLSARAQDVLRMVAIVEQSEGGRDVALDDLLEEYWELHAEKALPAMSLRPIALDSREDRLALEELQALGLLPSIVTADRRLPAERFAPITPTDPVRALARGLLGSAS